MEQTLIRPYTTERPLSGAQVGNYLLLRELGRGGYAHVYLAEHLYLKHQVALKLLNLSLTQHEDLVHFQFEARLLAQLRHRHIVRALDFGWEHDTPFLAMDYAPGGIIQQAFQRGVPRSSLRRGTGKRLLLLSLFPEKEEKQGMNPTRSQRKQRELRSESPEKDPLCQVLKRPIWNGRKINVHEKESDAFTLA